MGLEEIFRAYDVRGEVPEELDEEVMERIGRAFGTVISGEGAECAVVGRDVRESSPGLMEAMMMGMTVAGVDVVDAGPAPYGAVLLFGCRDSIPAAYVTASHLGEEFNGVKFARKDGPGFWGEDNEALRKAFFDEDFCEGEGDISEEAVLDDYIEHLAGYASMEPLKVLLDPGNGTASFAAPEVFWKSGAELEVMNGNENDYLSGRPSDVTEETLGDMMDRMEEDDFDVGFAYDGDADRLGVVDDSGRLLSAEETAYIVLEQLLEEEEGPVVTNVECSRLIEDVASEHGAEVVRSRVGHNYVFRKVLDTGACMGVEKSRHFGISKLRLLNDAIATSVYFASVVSGLDASLSEKVDGIPTYVRDRISFDVPDKKKFEVVRDMVDEIQEIYEDTDTEDGIRVDLEDGWVLVRASNTSPKVRMTVEAETEEDFEELKDRFSGMLEEKIAEVV